MSRFYQKTISNLDLPFQFTLLLFRCFYVNFFFVARGRKKKKEKTFCLNLPMQKNNAKMALTALKTFPLQHNIANVRVSVVWYTKKKSNILWGQNVLEPRSNCIFITKWISALTSKTKSKKYYYFNFYLFFKDQSAFTFLSTSF